MDELLKEWAEKFEDIDADIDILQQEIDLEMNKKVDCNGEKLHEMLRFRTSLEVWKNQFHYIRSNWDQLSNTD